MIANIQDVFVAPRSSRVGRGRLNARLVKEAFSNLRKSLDATTSHRDIRVQDPETGVTWSLWVGRFEKTLPWLLAGRFKETRYAFLLVLEHHGYIGTAGSNVGEASELMTDARVSYQKLLALHSTEDTEVEGISTRSLRGDRVGITRSTQSGRHLERVLPRVGANQSAPSQLAIRLDDKGWRISPGSGRVSLTGSRTVIAELCSWFKGACESIEAAAEPNDFIKAFAHPVALDDLPSDVRPTAVQLDPSEIDDLLESGAEFSRDNVKLSENQITELSNLIRHLWIIDERRSRQDETSRMWRLKVGDTEVAQISTKATKIRLAVDAFRNIRVKYADGSTETLNQVFNGGAQPFRITYSNPSYAYAGGQLFRDHRLLGNRANLLTVLSPELDPNADLEKGSSGDVFARDSLFAFVASTAAANDDYLICDDMGTEWADFVGVSSRDAQITFYHCKGGQIDVGASGLHEVVAQATKNLGYLTASRAELTARADKWRGTWKATAVPRLQRGGTVEGFISAFSGAAGAPQAIRRITIVTSGLSKLAVSDAFSKLEADLPESSALHVLWLLSAFVDGCKVVGALPRIICRP